MEAPRNKSFLHRGQMELMLIGAHDEYVIAPRGWGKSEGIDALRLVRNVFAMPRSAGAFLSPSYAKLLQNTLPAVAAAISRNFGFVRDRHYIIGRKPPKEWNWPKPINEPFSYDHVMSWFNGSIIHLISFDRPMSANSMSLDYVLGFEAKYLPIDKIKDEVFPAIRGNKQYFENVPWHLGKVFTTDMPMLKHGQWIHDMEKQMDPELIRLIQHLNYEKARLLSDPNSFNRKYLKQTLARLEIDIRQFRRQAIMYKECDPFDSLEIHGPEWWNEKRRETSTYIFDVSFLNKRPRRVQNGFYSGLNAKLHYYKSTNYHYADKLEYGYSKSVNPQSCMMDGDYDSTKPLLIAMDYNAAINTLVVGQVDEDENLNTINAFYVKTPLKVRDAVARFCKYYADAPKKEVIFYYDHTAVSETPGDSAPFYEIVEEVLKEYGWHSYLKYIGRAPNHVDKHLWIDEALKGNNYRFCRFNEERCELLLAAMETARIKTGRNGFEKDKSDEKKPDSPDLPDEKKTHITDAWDTLFIGANFHFTGFGYSYSIATQY